jgi:hypothetical protein
VSWLGLGQGRAVGRPARVGKRSLGWKSRPSVDHAEGWKKNLELGKGMLQRGTEGMALYIGANQLATNSPVVHGAWKKGCVLCDRVCRFRGEVTVPVLYKQCWVKSSRSVRQQGMRTFVFATSQPNTVKASTQDARTEEGKLEELVKKLTQSSMFHRLTALHGIYGTTIRCLVSA